MLSGRGDGKTGGFTLLELLLVIVVVGIIAGLAMPAISRRDDASLLLESARSLLAGMSLQEEEAVLTGSLRGLQLFRRSDPEEAGSVGVFYQWYTWSRTQDRWEPAADRAGRGELEGVAHAVLRVDDREVELPLLEPSRHGQGADERDERNEPQIVFLASGEISDFELILQPASGQGAQTVRGGYDGVRLGDGEDGAR